MTDPLRARFGKDRSHYRIIRELFGFTPGNIEIYKLALLHRSASLFLDDGTPLNNERLEYLGDSILQSIVSDYLFTEFPTRNEGFLTQVRSKIVSRTSLNRLGVAVGLDRYIIIGGGGGHPQKHLFGDAFEAMIGAIYLDKGFDFTNRLVINKLFYRHLDLEELSQTENDYKSRLIEWGQKSRQDIRFVTSFSENSTAREPNFRSLIVVDGKQLGYGDGGTKKEAEQNAAFMVSHLLSDYESELLLDTIDSVVENDDRRPGGE